MQTAAFEYDLPPAAIAQTPLEPRDAARLLVDGGAGRPADHRRVSDLPELLQPGDLLVLNATRVRHARLETRRPTGGRAEVLLLDPDDEGRWHALVRPSRRIPSGTILSTGQDLDVEVLDDLEGGRRLVRLLVGGDVLDERASAEAAVARVGDVPLPPYIDEPLGSPERYQTVFADRVGSAAAPTAGLHLTPAVIDACRQVGIGVAALDLRIGLGTFRPMTVQEVEDHPMHAERYDIPTATWQACREAARVVAVGTTVVRALESAAAGAGLQGSTELLIHRPYRFEVVDLLLTNFHLPRSSLLALVDAFVGPRWRELYAEALASGYRFLSFGDALLLHRTPVEERG